MKILNFKQGSEEWEQHKIGRIGGTRISQIVTKVKLDLSKSSTDLVLKLVDERITGLSSEPFSGNAATDRGNELEPWAREAYIKKTGTKIIEHGFWESDLNPLHGCSPDGVTEDLKGAIEIKCIGYKHLKYCSDKFPDSIYLDHKTQILNFFCVNEKLEWLDTVSYRPEFWPCPLHIERIERKDIKEDIEKINKAVAVFFEEFQKVYESYNF